MFFIPFTLHTQTYVSCTYFHDEVTSVIYIMGLDKCTFTSEIVIVFFFICRRMLTKVIGALKQHVQSFYTQKDSSFTFQPFVSQVLLCDGTRINAVVLLRFHFISGRHLDICFAFFSLSCSGVRVTREMFLYSFQNIAPSDLPNL